MSPQHAAEVLANAEADAYERGRADGRVEERAAVVLRLRRRARMKRHEGAAATALMVEADAILRGQHHEPAMRTEPGDVKR